MGGGGALSELESSKKLNEIPNINGQLKAEGSLVKTNPQRGTPFPLSGPRLLLFQCVFSLTEFVFGKENMLNKVVNQRTNKQHR